MKPKKPVECIPKLRILTLRDQRVLLDADLARLYGVETRALNQAVKRNLDRFPVEFAFPLTREEILNISQTVTSLGSLKYSKSVQVFTEHGALQAANVPTRRSRNQKLNETWRQAGWKLSSKTCSLFGREILNSPQAVQMSLYIIRAFVKMREELTTNATILKRLAEIDKSIFLHDSALRDIYRKLLPLLAPPPEPPRRRIGFNRDTE